ncbi:MAG: ABC transporter substrate-binding protein [Proteobacteria bacterium]|jgi:branched-chain amino acid transport system substrate-binding protein|nr:ABC transporter substrate-binding protein [Pseudomonadota bacterium]
MKQTNFFGLVLFFASLVIISLFVASGAIQAKEPVKIGAIIPITGTSEVEGQDMSRGLQIALDEINTAGGVLGRSLEVIVEDTETRPKSGLDAVHKLIDINKVPVILGGYFSSVSLPTGNYSNSQGVVQLTWSTSPALRKVGPFFFGICGTDELMAANTVKFAIEDARAKRFGIIVDNSAYGLGVLEFSKREIKKAGGEIVAEVKYEREKADYRPELQRVFAQKPEVVVGTLIGKDARTIFKQAYELGLKPQSGWYLSWISLATAPSIPETVEGVKGLIGRLKGKAANRFNEMYQEKYGAPPQTVWGHYIYDAVWLTALAINFANSPEPKAIKDALFKVAPVYRGVSGGGDKTFNADGMQKYEVYQRMVCKNGKLVIYQK